MSIKGQIVNLLRDLQRKNSLGLVFVSHDLRVVRYVADYIYVMYLGQIVEQGSNSRFLRIHSILTHAHCSPRCKLDITSSKKHAC